MFGKPKYNVKNSALPTNRNITKGYPATSKNTKSLKKSDIGLKASSILLSKPFSCANDNIGIINVKSSS